MNLNDYISITYTSRNDAGHEEIQFEFAKTFLQRLFNRPAASVTFFQLNGYWVDAKTHKGSTYEDHVYITHIRNLMKKDQIPFESKFDYFMKLQFGSKYKYDTSCTTSKFKDS